MAMTFQKTVLAIATVILILFLIILAIILWTSRNELQFPPEIGTCPDYFEPTVQNKKHMCKNVKGLGNKGGNCGDDTTGIDFSGYSLKEKKRWARNCGVTWDGLTNQ
jgi:hypothetical protein